MTIVVSPNVSAETTSHIQANSTNEYIYTNEFGNEMIFPTIEDYDIYVFAHRATQPRYGEIWLLEETLETSKIRHHFLDYHSGTPVWSPASSYTINRGTTYNVGGDYSWKGISLDLGFSYSFSVDTTIPANASKYSRLGVYADYTLKRERYAEYKYGQPTGNTRVSTYASRTATYIEPVYQ
jgi:hypothetical protein